MNFFKDLIKMLFVNLPMLRGSKLEKSLRFARTYKCNFGSIKFTGQFFQDLIAYLYLQKKTDGFFVDIGANDGISGSNTYALEQMGWKGICIEPQPDVYRILKKYRKCDCYNVALSTETHGGGGGNMQFAKIHGMSGRSGFIDLVSEYYKTENEKKYKVEYINVEITTFEKIMSKYPTVTHIDFMSIDVESHEMTILETIDFNKYRFGIITIEKSEPEKIKTFMLDKEYKCFMEIGADLMFIPK